MFIATKRQKKTDNIEFNVLSIINPKGNKNDIYIRKIDISASSKINAGILISDDRIAETDQLITDVINSKIGDKELTTAIITTLGSIYDASFMKVIHISEAKPEQLIKRDDGIVLRAGYQIAIRVMPYDSFADISCTISYDEKDALQGREER